MLELKNIVKNYQTGSECVEALRGISTAFRDNEFVAVLGPSGCGKTTLLNIIGGLDQYTSGDLVINGVSTKQYRDRDWDTYRNHSIGFVFQSYNLIPHQTVLQNVELALTLSGVKKAERHRRAKEALEKVGLSSQLKKRPNELSGGQMQRVAIARAIVNDPDIILADEPTGALDTETSVQVMEILKEISRDRLIIMVTHNPDLAEQYATRTIRVLDGKITDDSAPLTEEDWEAGHRAETARREEKQTKKQPSMSFATSFGLSLKNLFTKKGRTLLTSFAGSIGIIGIALILSVSQGMTAYIDTVQEETLSSYPLSLEEKHINMGSLLQTFMDSAKSSDEHERDAVYEKSMMYDLINSLNTLEETENDLTSFKAYLEKRLADEKDTSGLREAVTGVQYGYDLDLLIYTENVDGKIIRSDPTLLMKTIIAQYMGKQTAENAEKQTTGGSNPMSSLFSAGGSGGYALWQEMLPGNNGELLNDLFEKQYEKVYGNWPTAYNEIVLVLDENNELDDVTLYALGLIPESTIKAITDAAADKTQLEVSSGSWSYKDICGMEFRTVLNSDCYVADEKTGLYTDLRETDAGLRYLYANALPLKVSGIIRPKDDALTTILTGSIGYTHALTDYVMQHTAESDAVKAQLADANTDIFTGLPFKEATGNLSAADKKTAVKAYLADLSPDEKAAIYVKMMSLPSQKELDKQVDAVLSSMSREDMEKAMSTALTQQMGMAQDTVDDYLSGMDDEDLKALFADATAERVKAQYAAQVSAQLQPLGTVQLVAMLEGALPTFTDEQFAQYYDEILEFSDTTYDDNLTALGYVLPDHPSSIRLYASSFEHKDDIEAAIAAYNDTMDELHRIEYTDYVGIMMSSVTTIINAITYVLIAFVAISLIVSSIMIGVITLISVQERTKEIGILRAIGASKKNVSRMFNAETVIIGFAAGLLGVAVTYLLCIPINLILHSLTGIENLSAYLPLPAAGVLILISVLLTLIAGVIPSRSAAKKDPVVALRTE